MNFIQPNSSITPKTFPATFPPPPPPPPPPPNPEATSQYEASSNTPPLLNVQLSPHTTRAIPPSAADNSGSYNLCKLSSENQIDDVYISTASDDKANSNKISTKDPSIRAQFPVAASKQHDGRRQKPTRNDVSQESSYLRQSSSIDHMLPAGYTALKKQHIDTEKMPIQTRKRHRNAGKLLENHRNDFRIVEKETSLGCMVAFLLLPSNPAAYAVEDLSFTKAVEESTGTRIYCQTHQEECTFLGRWDICNESVTYPRNVEASFREWRDSVMKKQQFRERMDASLPRSKFGEADATHCEKGNGDFFQPVLQSYSTDHPHNMHCEVFSREINAASLNGTQMQHENEEFLDKVIFITGNGSCEVSNAAETLLTRIYRFYNLLDAKTGSEAVIILLPVKFTIWLRNISSALETDKVGLGGLWHQLISDEHHPSIETIIRDLCEHSQQRLAILKSDYELTRDENGALGLEKGRVCLSNTELCRKETQHGDSLNAMIGHQAVASGTLANDGRSSYTQQNTIYCSYGDQPASRINEKGLNASNHGIRGSENLINPTGTYQNTDHPSNVSADKHNQEMTTLPSNQIPRNCPTSAYEQLKHFVSTITAVSSSAEGKFSLSVADNIPVPTANYDSTQMLTQNGLQSGENFFAPISNPFADKGKLSSSTHNSVRSLCPPHPAHRFDGSSTEASSGALQYEPTKASFSCDYPRGCEAAPIKHELAGIGLGADARTLGISEDFWKKNNWNEQQDSERQYYDCTNGNNQAPMLDLYDAGNEDLNPQEATDEPMKPLYLLVELSRIVGCTFVLLPEMFKSAQFDYLQGLSIQSPQPKLLAKGFLAMMQAFAAFHECHTLLSEEPQTLGSFIRQDNTERMSTSAVSHWMEESKRYQQVQGRKSPSPIKIEEQASMQAANQGLPRSLLTKSLSNPAALPSFYTPASTKFNLNSATSNYQHEEDGGATRRGAAFSDMQLDDGSTPMHLQNQGNTQSSSTMTGGLGFTASQEKEWKEFIQTHHNSREEPLLTLHMLLNTAFNLEWSRASSSADRAGSARGGASNGKDIFASLMANVGTENLRDFELLKIDDNIAGLTKSEKFFAITGRLIALKAFLMFLSQRRRRFQHVTVNLIVPDDKLSFLIGKAGGVINRIIKESGAQLQVNRKRALIDGKFRILMIKGKSEQKIKACFLVHQKLGDLEEFFSDYQTTISVLNFANFASNKISAREENDEMQRYTSDYFSQEDIDCEEDPSEQAWYNECGIENDCSYVQNDAPGSTVFKQANFIKQCSPKLENSQQDRAGSHNTAWKELSGSHQQYINPTNHYNNEERAAAACSFSPYLAKQAPSNQHQYPSKDCMGISIPTPNQNEAAINSQANMHEFGGSSITYPAPSHHNPPIALDSSVLNLGNTNMPQLTHHNGSFLDPSLFEGSNRHALGFSGVFTL